MKLLHFPSSSLYRFLSVKALVGTYTTRNTCENFAKFRLQLYHTRPRFPLEVSPVWNQVRLMSPASWAASCASLLAVVGCLNLASLLVRRHMAMRVQTRELLLYPFRSHQLTSECSLSSSS